MCSMMSAGDLLLLNLYMRGDFRVNPVLPLLTGAEHVRRSYTPNVATSSL